MYKLIAIVCILNTVYFLQSQAAQSILDGRHDEHPDKCFYAEGSVVLSPGEKKSFSGEDCCMIECKDNLNIVKSCCGIESFEYLPPFCNVTNDETKPHPECCGKVKCDQVVVPQEAKP